MKCTKYVLPNGLRLLLIPMPNLESVTVTVWNRVGSRYETPRINGLAHFYEHIVFKGGKKYPTAREVSEAVDSFGGEFNASTGKEITQFYIKSHTDKLENALDILSDIVLSPKLDSEDIAREKGVIKAEIDMYEDTPIRKIEEYYENLLYRGNPLEYDIAGTKQSIDAIGRRDFAKFMTEHYHTGNMLITVAGGTNVRKTKSLVSDYFSQLKKAKLTHPKPFHLKQNRPQLEVKHKKTDQAHFILGYMGYPAGHKDRYSEAVLMSILGGGMSSRLFTEVREKRGLAYAVKTYTDHYSDTGCFSTYAGTTPSQASEAIRTILSEYKKISSIKDCHISGKELRKAKGYLKGQIALSLEDTSAVNQFFGVEELLLGKTRSVREVFTAIDRVTVPEIASFAKRTFVPSRLNLAVLGPFKSESKFEALLRRNS